MRQFMLVLIGLTLCPVWAWGQGQIILEAGAQMVASGQVNLVAENLDWQQDGTLVPGNSVIILRNDANNVPVELNGSGPLAFYDLRPDCDGTDLILQVDISVAHELDMVEGLLDLNGQEIDLLGTGSLVNETDARRIVDNSGGGGITTTVLLNAPSQVQPGNLGATITSSANLGNTTIRRGHQIQPLVAATGLERYYDIDPATNTGLNAIFRFAYFQGELNGTNEGNLLLYQSTDGGISYSSQGISQISPSDDWIELIGINAFSRWTAGEGTAFAVEWLGIEARWLHSGPLAPAVISWETGSEVGSDFFRVERRSLQSSDWTVVGTMPAVQQGRYTLTDTDTESLQKFPEWQFRVVEVDIDGRESASDIVSLRREVGAADLRVSPNPSEGIVRVQASLPLGQTTQELSLRDLQGKRIWSQTLDAAGALDRNFTLPALPAGVYLIELTTNLERHRIRLQVSP